MLGEFFKPAPALRPQFNLGCLLDIPTGTYLTGKHGESILNGGLSHLTGIAGAGNTFKSTLAFFMLLRALSRITTAHSNVYDTEISLTMERLIKLSWWMENIGKGALEEAGRLILSNKNVQSGNEWFDAYREYVRAKVKKGGAPMLTTPFVNRTGEAFKMLVPGLFGVDSFSQYEVDVVLEMYEKNTIGSSGLNMEAMKAGSAKSQLMKQLPGLTGSSASYIVMTAHVGDEFNLDPYAPPRKKLSFMRGNVKLKSVPENFTFLTNNCWYVVSSRPFQNRTTKGPEYPRHSGDNKAGDTDLNVITVMNLRGKGGPSGMPFEIVVSQSEGILPGLSELNYIKAHKSNSGDVGYGMGGHDRSYHLDLLPDVSLSRTTVRGKIEEDKRLQRALEITSEMCQMANMWHHLDEGLLCTPKELYEDLKAKGYDWDILLGRTRGYWVFEEMEKDVPEKFLSTMDLLNVRAGTYRPWWYDELAKESAAAKAQ